MYEQFFGLEDEPFRLTPDPRYLYLSPKHAEALAHLRLGLTESSGFVCITGDVGTGKTTLLRTFLSEMGPDITAAYAFVPPLSAADLLRRICREFGLPVAEQNQAELTEQLYAFLVAQHEGGRRCVVVLDEAQALSIELLEQIRLLLNLETETKKLLCIVLVGQPQLRRLLLDPGLAQLNQRITLRWHLGPLSYRETVAYVEHRLTVASGGRPTHLFSLPALRLMHSVSDGVPRLINMVAHRALLAAFVARESRVTRRVVARAYHEIQAVPLPGTLSLGRKAGFAAAGLAIGAGLVVFGAPRLDRLLHGPPAAATPESATDVARKVDAALAAPTAAAPLAAVPPAALPPLDSAPPALASTGTTTTAPAAPAPLSAAELARSLAILDTDESTRSATEVVLAAWGERPLANDRLATGIESIAWRYGLQDLVLTGNNRNTLRVLDLPAVVALAVPGGRRPRYVALTGMDASQAVVSIGGVARTIDSDSLDQLHPDEVHVLWRDFDGLGTALRAGAQGVAVMRLQKLLQRVGVLHREPTGVFDAATTNAVVAFQRTHFVAPDGIVGPLTSIVLYASAGGHAHPTLAIPAGTAS
jgi:general secretion pathway protein A